MIPFEIGPSLITDSLTSNSEALTIFSPSAIEVMAKAALGPAPLSEGKVAKLSSLLQQGASKPIVVITATACLLGTQEFPDPKRFLSILMIMKDESNFDPSAVNPTSRASGLMQLLPSVEKYATTVAGGDKGSVLASLGPLLTFIGLTNLDLRSRLSDPLSLLESGVSTEFDQIIPTSQLYKNNFTSILKLFEFKNNKWSVKSDMTSRVNRPIILDLIENESVNGGVLTNYYSGLHFLTYVVWLHGMGAFTLSKQEVKSGPVPLAYLSDLSSLPAKEARFAQTPLVSAREYLQLLGDLPGLEQLAGSLTSVLPSLLK